MDQVAFHTEVRSWLVKIIRQRSLLVRRGASRKNDSLMIANCDHLQKYLNYFPYNTDVKMARFFLTNLGRIESLLPGYGASAYDKYYKEFVNYRNLANKILNNYENLHLRTHKQRAQQYSGSF